MRILTSGKYTQPVLGVNFYETFAQKKSPHFVYYKRELSGVNDRHQCLIVCLGYDAGRIYELLHNLCVFKVCINWREFIVCGETSQIFNKETYQQKAG